MDIADFLLRLGGWAGGSIADGVFRDGWDLGVLHGLTDDVGHARLLGPTVGVLLGSLLLNVLGLEGAVPINILSIWYSIIHRQRHANKHRPPSPINFESQIVSSKNSKRPKSQAKFNSMPDSEIRRNIS